MLTRSRRQVYNQAMNFEHLIQINDPANPLLVSLTRQQVWTGLLQRVENPMLFLPGLEDCTILERCDTHLLRALRFSAETIIHDRVVVETLQSVHFEILPGAHGSGSSLHIRIEEPTSKQLFLRFTYQSKLGESTDASEDQAYAGYIKSAYQQSDIDTVGIIRNLAADDGTH